MKPSKPIDLPFTRREFLRTTGKGLGLLAFSGFAPNFLTRSALAQVPQAEKDRSILVLVQLAGGNDGLNTVVPFEDDHYFRLRPRLGITDALKIGDNLGLNPAAAPLERLFKDGRLSIVQNVGYPNPNRSHFRSTEIWETATDSDQTSNSGWVGRFLDNTCAGNPKLDQQAAQAGPAAIHIGNETPQSFTSTTPHPVFGVGPRVNAGDTGLLKELADAGDKTGNGAYLQQTLMDALVTEKRVQKVINSYKPMANYPEHGLARSLRQVASLIASGLETRVYFVSQGGYDTHAGQIYRHPRLLTELSESLAAFQSDLEAHRLDEQVLTMTFSEFGRRPNENISQGTDHGTSAPLFVMGTQVQQPLVGTPPSLDIPANQDTVFSTDFRQVYSTVLSRWFDADATAVIGSSFAPLDFI